jgi:hypothetical protein
MEGVFRTIVAPVVHSTNAGLEEEYAGPFGCVGDMAGNVKCVVSKCIFVDSIAQFCGESQQGWRFGVVCVAASRH